MTQSQQLLAEYLTNGSETAFRELVMRYTGLVYSTALRLVDGDTHRAEDVAQTVFVDLARLARKLSAETMLGGWLYRHTCFVAAKAIRGERRRQARERQAVEMNALEDHSEASFAQVAPILDEAINQLAPEDQSAIVLRFFEQLDFPSMGEALGSTEEAARKRVNRALDKLRDLLTARGVTLSVTALGAALAARAVEAAPAELVASLARTALASAAAGHGTTLTFLKLMTTSKISLSVASAVVIAGVTWLAWTLWGPWLPAKAPPLALNGTWTVLSKGQPLGHVVLPMAIALDGKGALYVADIPQGSRIQKRDVNGNWTLVASTGQSLGGLKGVVLAMAFDGSGSLYVAEQERIVKRDDQGNWTILATQGKELGQVNGPRALTLDREGNLYVADGWGEGAQVLLRKPDGQWIRLAGHGNEVGEVMNPQGLAIDAEGNLYIADTPPRGKRIQKRDTTGRWSTLDEDEMSAGDLGSPLALVANFEKMTCDASGALYVSAEVKPLRSPTNQLLKRDAQGRWSQLAAQGSGPGQVVHVRGMSVDSSGALYVAEFSNNRIQKRDPNGAWTVVCEALKEPGVFVTPCSPALDSRGNLYVVDYARRQIQKRDVQGRWTVMVDVPKQVIELEDPSFPIGIDPTWPLPFWLPAFCLFKSPLSVAVDREDNLYVADSGYNRVMKLNTRGEWELCVPSGTGVGETTEPKYVSVDASDNLYLIDGPLTDRLQKRDPEGRWTVLASPGRPEQIFGFCAAPNGNVYVAGERRVRMRDPQGGWTLVASEGTEIGQVGSVGGLATDSSGRLYVVDNGNHRLQVRDLDGRWSVLGAANSEASPLFMEYGVGILVDRQGVVYVTDTHRVFRWTPQPQPEVATAASEKKK